MLFTLAATLFSLLECARAVVNPWAVTGSIDVHDPTMCKDANGRYWLFSTGVGIPIRFSPDRINWYYIGLVWPNGASWTDIYTGTPNGNLRAPDVNYIDGKFRLFYSASTPGSNKSGIFYATSSTGSWINGGLVTSTSPTTANYNAVDPNLFVSPTGEWYLSFGSFLSGIKLASLSSTGKLSSSSLLSLAVRPVSSGSAIEGSTLYYTNGFYYLFSSWDSCCAGTSSTYNIRVGRFTRIYGGYTDAAGVSLLSGGGTLVLGTHDSIYAPGGQDIMDDVDGPILVYHYYTSAGSRLGINRLDFSSGWPVVV